MKKALINKLDLTIYSEKLENGLTVFVVPDKNNNNIYATFSTKYGSRINDFVPINSSKMIHMPYGIAHFLEHKVFEQKDGVDPFTFFSERGSDANANTSYNKTTYLFSGSKFFEENLNFLLDYVGEPYFTDENVEKEKGIIISEYEMYQDNPFTKGYEGILKNAFSRDSIRYSIIGTKKSIRSITKEQLYDCYNTFYHPSNMFVVVTGNVEPENVINIIKQNQVNKSYDEFKKIKIKKFGEPEEVTKQYEKVKMDVTTSKVLIGYKINIKNLQVEDKLKELYIVSLFEILFGSTSIANEYLKTNDIIYGNISLDYVEAGDYLLFIVCAEVKKEKEFIEYIDKQFVNIKLTKQELERKKKASIGYLVAVSNDIFWVNNKIMNDYILYGKPICNDYDMIEKMNIDVLSEIIQNISFDNKTVYVINPKSD